MIHTTPRWYCPPNTPKPKHAVVTATMSCIGGPPGAIPGGMVYGGPIENDTESGWYQHPAGHWFNLDHIDTAILVRLDTDPRFIHWSIVAGADPGQLWRVPRLLEPERDEITGDVMLFKSALDRIWQGDKWNLPERIEALMRELLDMHYALGNGTMTLASPAAVNLALKVLAEGQTFDPHEVVKSGLVSEVLIVRTLLATVGMGENI